MNYLVAAMVNRSCAFVITMDRPVETLQIILDFLQQRKIRLETLQLHATGGAEAKLILHCLIEKDRIKHVKQGMEKMSGILELSLLEQRG
jgi:hypothetical protein